MIYTDEILERKIAGLQNSIITWAQKNGIWTDSWFSTYFETFQEEPNDVAACVSVLASDGGIFQMLNGYNYDELLSDFEDIIDKTEFYLEHYNHYQFQIFCKEDGLNQAYLDYYEWQWICSLVKADYTSLYEELYDYFNKNPKKLYNLSSRSFEILISEIFRNQGYRTELGKGQGDGGIDVRLFKKDGIDEIVTLVQVKKYKSDLPIKLEAVSSLSGLVHVEKAKNGLFVTTSRYLPVAQKFAKRDNSLIKLADSNDISEWCKDSRNLILRDKSLLFSDKHLLEISRPEFNNGLVGKIAVASVGYNMVRNELCIVVKDTPSVALLMIIPSQTIQYLDAPYNLKGYEMPLINEQLTNFRSKEYVFRAKKNYSQGKLSFSGNGHTYFRWNGEPLYFDHID